MSSLKRSYQPRRGYKSFDITRTLSSIAANKIGQWWKGTKHKRGALKAKLRERPLSAIKTERLQREKVVNEGSSTSQSFTDFGSKPKYANAITKLGAPEYYVKNEASNYQSGIGVQSAFDYGQAIYPELNAMFNTITSTPVLCSRMLVEHITGEYLIANAASYTTFITMYDCICRRDCPSNAVAGPTVAWTNGVQDESSAGYWGTVGTTAYDSELFNQYYRVVKETRLDLPAGGIHRHTVKYSPNKVIHNEVVSRSTSPSGGGLMDLGIFTLFVFHGQPAHDSTTITSVTVSAASLDVVHKFDIKYRFLQDSSSGYTRTNNLGASFAAGPQIVNDLVGQVQDGTGLHPGTLLS